MPPRIEMKGKVYGNLTVVEETAERSFSGAIMWSCLCTCGKTVIVNGSSLRNLQTVSCGCYGVSIFLQRVTKHGRYKTPAYKSWGTMLQRCLNPLNPNYEDYGGRGITVCDRWNPKVGGSFEFFIEDMGERPTDRTLDRIDTMQGYSKENCRWATRSTQGYNQRKRSTNTSGITGVYWCSTREKWKAEIKVYPNRLCLGSFLTKEEAVSARKDAELLYYGVSKIEDPEDAA